MATKKPVSEPGTWYVLSRLGWDGKVFEPGDSVDLDDATGDSLRALGVVSRVAPVADATPEDEPA